VSLKILHQDEDLVAVDKPAGQLVIPGRGETAGPALNFLLEQALGQKIFIVHRIDRETSGLVLFAKNPEAHRALSLQFEKRETQKLYLAVVEGKPPEEGRIDLPLKEFGSGRMGPAAAGGKESLTEYWSKEELRGATLVETRIRTGRRHQIRAHFYAIGHPVLGDTLYGKSRPVGNAGRLMLHAHSLTFEIPSGGTLSLKADLPDDFRAVLSTLKL
jgi:RluA family pseudouridine synthase